MVEKWELAGPKAATVTIEEISPTKYRIGPMEFEIAPGSNLIGWRNTESQVNGSANLDAISEDYGEEVGKFFRDKMGFL